MSYNKLRKKRRQRADVQSEKKGKTGRTGANEPPKLTEVENSLAGGIQQTQERILELEGSMQKIQDGLTGANKRGNLTNRRLDMMIQQINDKLGKVDEGLSDMADEINLITDSHLELVEVLIKQGVIIEEDLAPPEVEEEEEDSGSEEVEEVDEIEHETEEVSVPSIEELEEEVVEEDE